MIINQGYFKTLASLIQEKQFVKRKIVFLQKFYRDTWYGNLRMVWVKGKEDWIEESGGKERE